jgi:serine protease Do
MSITDSARRRRFSGALLEATLALALVCIVASTSWASAPNELWTEKSGTRGLDPEAPVHMSSFAELADEVSSSVINIRVKKLGARSRNPLAPLFRQPEGREGFSQGFGTGFVIHKDGLALTNHHVIEGATLIEVQLSDERTYPARVVGTYPELDVALIRFEAQEEINPAPLGDSSALRIGEWVVAIGNPFGLNHTVTAGIVSAKGRRDVHPGPRNGDQPSYSNFIQTDASINPGNSGGPLFNIRGEVVGINTAINAAGQGIGFAVPIDMVKTILPQLAKGRVKRSFLGVRIGPVNRSLARSVGLKSTSGALVREVIPRGAADAAGVQAGDIILAWNERPIEHWEDLSWVASTSDGAERIKLNVLRGSTQVELFAHLKPHPDDRQSRVQEGTRPPKSNSTAALQDLGLQVAKVSAKHLKKLGLRRGHGVGVIGVDRGSPAEFYGIETGDVLVRVNGRPIVGGLADFNARVRAVKPRQALALLIRRGNRTLFITFAR